MSLFTDQVSASSDDASQGASGVVSTTATTNAMTTTANVTWTGNRFLNVTIPNGATVSAADMSLDFSSVFGGLGVVSINCEDTATPATYATTTNDISSRTYTTAGSGVSWTMPSTTGYHASTDISAAAQAVLALAGWASGNNLAIGTECSTSRASNNVDTYDNSTSTSAELSITYTASSTPGLPTGLSAAYASPTSVALSWTQGSGTVTDNKVQYSTDDATWATIDIGSAATSYTVTGLMPGQLYYFQVAAGNTGGFSAYTAYDPWVCGSNFTGQLAASSDDAFQNTLGAVTITDATDTLVALDYLGFRFQNIAVPVNADISGAYLLVYLTSVTGISGSIVLDFENVANSTTFAASSNNISNRTLTGQSVTWGIGSLGTGWNTSPNLADAFEAVTDLSGWASGNASNVIVRGLVGAAGFTTQMWDGNPVQAAVLAIYYSVASTDESGTFGDQFGMMASSNNLVLLESQPAAFVAY